jgi:hypothetical protein
MLLDAKAIEQKLERSLTYKFDKKIEAQNLSIMDRDQKITTQVQEIRKKEEMLQAAGITFDIFGD